MLRPRRLVLGLETVRHDHGRSLDAGIAERPAAERRGHHHQVECVARIDPTRVDSIGLADEPADPERVTLEGLWDLVGEAVEDPHGRIVVDVAEALEARVEVAPAVVALEGYAAKTAGELPAEGRTDGADRAPRNIP